MPSLAVSATSRTKPRTCGAAGRVFAKLPSMTEAAGASAGKRTDSASIAFEDSQFQAKSIPVALELMLSALDQCRHMMENAEPERAFSSTPVGQRSSTLSVRERRTLDAELSAFWEDGKKRYREDAEHLGIARELGIVQDKEKPEDAVYPWAPELSGSIQNVLFANLQGRLLQDHFAKYSNDAIKAEYILANVRLGPDVIRKAVLGSALIPLVVSKVEEFLGALLRTALALHPNTLGELPSIPDDIFRRYQAHLSSSDILRWQIDQKVTSLINGSPSDWRTTIQKRMGIDIAKVGADWARVEEVIQRRHAIIHNNGLVDDAYMAKVESRLKAGLQVGSPLICGTQYMFPVLVELETWALCLATYWAKRLFKVNALYHPFALSRVVDLESMGRWTHAIDILNALLTEPLPEPVLVSTAQVNRWFCLQEIGQDYESLRREIINWEPGEDDEADLFYDELGRAALLRNYTNLARLIRRGLGDEALGFDKKYMREAPLMQRAMRESTEIASLLRGPSTSRIRAASRPKRHGRGRKR